MHPVGGLPITAVTLVPAVHACLSIKVQCSGPAESQPQHMLTRHMAPRVASDASPKHSLLATVTRPFLRLSAVQVHAVGGLRVISAAAQPNRRAEAQLRGRAGRRGDPGETFSLISCYDEYCMAASSLVRGMVDQSKCTTPVLACGSWCL